MMRYAVEFRDPARIAAAVAAIRRLATTPVSFMEVCGTHTAAIFKHGLPQLLPGAVRLISGPGCPVCVTAPVDIDRAVAIAHHPKVTLATFGDMLRVPGSRESLEDARAAGCDVRVVYSPRDALELAASNAGQRVVFFGIGFETTSPGIAATVLEAHRRGLANFFVYSAHKLIPPAMRALLEARDAHIDGFVCPGHVSAVIGVAPYQFIPSGFRVPCVITGFEPLDILQSIVMLLRQSKLCQPTVAIQYRRGVPPNGNPIAREYIAKVFEPCEAAWRGLGDIPDSGLRLRPEFAAHDAVRAFSVDVTTASEPTGCLCGAVLRGTRSPDQCPLFARACRPERPVGPCMVSSEGTCAAWYHYAQEPGG